MSVATLPDGHRFWTMELADAVLPEDCVCREVLEGELVVPVSGPSFRHQVAVGDLCRVIHQARPLGWWVLTAPLDVPMPWGDVAQPDVLVCSPEQGNLDDGVIAAPSVVVEVLSPSTRRHDLVVKRRLYERFGVEVYVIVDIDAGSFTVLELDDEGRLIETQEGPTVRLTRPYSVTLSL